MDRPEDSLEQQASVYEMIREDIISGRLGSARAAEGRRPRRALQHLDQSGA